MKRNHDHSYKQLFSHPEMVRDLIQGFVREEWVKELDFSSLEKVSGSYVTDDLRDREDDIIWRLRWGDGWLYVYLLLEFQSTIDRYMAIRVLVYVALLYQDLIKSKQTLSDGRLPPVFPIVLYNGKKRWDAVQEVADLIVSVPGGLEAYQPRFHYLLLDEGKYTETDLPAKQNLAAALFSLENSRKPVDIQRVVSSLVEWLQAPEQTSLRRAFTVWLHRVLLPARFKGVEIPSVIELQEVKNMLAERVKEWTMEWKEEGLQAGRQEGLQEGLQEG
ncbi:MAG: Rpn family recombination-promoting nuclease/putative transposase, partial [bacterium]|nr:Rpn family recombination-promoting nuclease/putative transposase [bacterium]